MQNVREVISVQARWRFQLYLALRPPGYSESCGMKHEKVVGTVSHSQSLRNRD